MAGNRVVDIMFQTRGRANRDYAGSKLDTNGDIVVGNEASFAKTDGQLQGISAGAGKAGKIADIRLICLSQNHR